MSIKTLQILINAGANLNSRNNKGNTALMIASKHVKQETAKILIDAKANLNLQNNLGDTALMIASFSSCHPNIETIKLLIDAGANLDLINDKEGHTALMMASSYSCKESSIELLKLLIEAGANLDMQDKNGWTALILASLNLDGNINKDEKKRKISTAKLKLLIDAGANLNLQTKKGSTALMDAVSSSNEFSSNEIVKLLIEAGANLDLQDYFGRTALMLSSKYMDSKSSIETVKLLIEKGANLDLQDIDGNTLLMETMKCEIRFQKDLYSNSYRKNFTSNIYLSALGQDNLDKLRKLLVDAGANLYLMNKDGYTAYQIGYSREKKKLNEMVIFKVWKIRELSSGYIKNAFSVYNVASNVFLYLRPK